MSKENTIILEAVHKAIEFLKSGQPIPDYRREVAFAHLLAEAKKNGDVRR